MEVPYDNITGARYERQLWMKSIQTSGQEKLTQASVLIIGAGGLGSSASYYLTAAGVGTIGIADYDTIETSNLNRQILYSTSDLGYLKADTARKKLLDLNPGLRINSHVLKVDTKNIISLASSYDLILDASDNYPTRYLINDYCVKENKALFFGSVSAWSGIFFAWIPLKNQACFRCLYPIPLAEDLASKERTSGIIGVSPGLIGSIMASQAIQYIVHQSFGLENRFLWIDLEKGVFTSYQSKINLECSSCHHPSAL
jgi:molybdopterin/thiamine biosynthesis adenylyltransferase